MLQLKNRTEVAAHTKGQTMSSEATSREQRRNVEKPSEHRDALLPSPPRSPRRPKTPSPKLYRTTGNVTKSKVAPNTLQGIAGNQKPQKSAIKDKKVASRQKSVTWHTDVIDNSDRERMHLAFSLLSPTLCASDFKIPDLANQHRRRSMNTTHGVLPATSPAAEHGRDLIPQTHSSKAQGVDSKPTTVNVFTASAAHEQSPRNGGAITDSSRARGARVPPSVPDAPYETRGSDRGSPMREQFPSEPPPLPRPERLTTPDLPDIDTDKFCDCCEYQDAKELHRSTDQSRTKQKWEQQYEDALSHINSSRRRGH